MIIRDTVEESWNSAVLHECLRSAEKLDTKDFLDCLRSFIGAAGTFWAFSSGRQALETLLRDGIDKNRPKILTSSFNCSVVADAIIRAGYSVETYDLGNPNGIFHWHEVAQLLSDEYAAIIVPHLFGVPTDFRSLKIDADKLGILTIEDCAHTLGGKIEEKHIGTIGDAAIFSFNYDKPISLGGGGVLLVNLKSVAKRIHIEPVDSSIDEELHSINHFIEWMKQRRENIPKQSFGHRCMRNGLSKLGLYRPLTQLSAKTIGPLRSALGIWQIKKYNETIEKRNNNANFIREGIKENTWFVDKNVTPAWLRQKVIPKNTRKAKIISHHLQRKGFRVGRFNWRITIDEYLGLPAKPNASFLARYGLDVPIHQNMTKLELDIIKKELAS